MATAVENGELNPTQQLEDQDDEVLVEEVLRDVMIIEAALANSSASRSTIHEIDIILDNENGDDNHGSNSDSASSTFASVDTAIAPMPQPPLSVDPTPASTAVRTDAFAEAPTPPWTALPFEFGANDWRYASLYGRDGFRRIDDDVPSAGDAPPMLLLPVAAVCVLLLLLSSWGQMRRSRRRVLERQNDDAWRRDVDLLEAAY